MSSGTPFRRLAYSFRIGKSTIATIVGDTCQAIWNCLQNIHIPLPTSDMFKKIAQDFYTKWGFPHCIGSMDGKHIRIKCPPNSGSMYFNYKHFFSINLLAVTDANYKFITVDIGAYGKDSDGGVLSNSKFQKCIENETFNIPKEEKLPNSNIIAPYVFIGDEAFPLRSYLMRPYPRNQLQDSHKKAVFNYNLSKARMTVECSFGIAAAKWRILNKPIETSVDKAIIIVQAIAVLHNIIIDFEGIPKDFNGFVEKQMRYEKKRSARQNDNVGTTRRNNRASNSAIEVRNTFCKYFMENKNKETNI